MDYKTALEEIEKAIEQIREKNAKIPVIVEGKKDIKALRKLGINGKVLTVYRGKEISNLCDDIALHYKEIIILTDWDDKGGYICRMMEENLKGRTKCFTEYRKIFAQNSMVKDLESIPTFLNNAKNRLNEGKMDRYK